MFCKKNDILSLIIHHNVETSLIQAQGKHGFWKPPPQPPFSTKKKYLYIY